MTDDAVQNEEEGKGAELTGSSDVELLARFLSDRDHMCPFCGHNLRSLQSDRCPECGSHLSLRVATRLFPVNLWVVCLTLTSIEAFYLSVVSGIAAIVLMIGYSVDTFWDGLIYLNCPFVFALIDVYLSIILIIHRSRFCGLSVHKRALITFVLILWFVAQIITSWVCLYKLDF